MILETYQEEKAIEPQEENNKAYGTITAVTKDGINVRFDGETEASTKPFYCNSGISYKVGDRVLLEKVNGGYVIICTVGKEGTAGGGGEKIAVYNTNMYRNLSGGLSSFTVTPPINNVIGVCGVYTTISNTLITVGINPTTNALQFSSFVNGSGVSGYIYYSLLYKE